MDNQLEYSLPELVNLSFSKSSHGGGCNGGGAPTDCGGGGTPSSINNCSRGTSEATYDCAKGDVAGADCNDGTTAVTACIAEGSTPNL